MAKPFALAAALCAAVALAAPAFAEDAPAGDKPHKGMHRFAALDTNHDKFLTMDELKAAWANRPRALEHLPTMFKKLDKNNDGKLDETEYKARRHQRRHHGGGDGPGGEGHGPNGTAGSRGG